MRLRRREVLAALGALALGACAPAASPVVSPAGAPGEPPRRSSAAKRILVLGGTGFAGPPIVRSAIERGHTVTLFNRGKTNPGLFPNVETILGDRMTQLDMLRGRNWDAVVDTWAQGPTLVGRAAELLRDQVGQYVFLSTISVYKLTRGPLDEGSPTLTLPLGVTVADIKKVDETTYGPVKVLAEQAAEAAMPGRSTSVRSGLIVGPGDPTDRFTYWPLRIARGGEMIAPGAPDDPMQFIDVRDLGAWMVRTIEDRTVGVYDAVGPDTPLFGAVLDACKRGTGSDVRFSWIDEAWLDKNDLGGWESFPAHVSANDAESGFARVSAARAIAKGLRFRPVEESARDSLAWWNAQSEERRAKKRPGISPDREAEILARWHQERG
jgi:2'-hydroxyisoflavone reductase